MQELFPRQPQNFCAETDPLAAIKLVFGFYE